MSATSTTRFADGLFIGRSRASQPDNSTSQTAAFGEAYESTVGRSDYARYSPIASQHRDRGYDRPLFGGVPHSGWQILVSNFYPIERLTRFSPSVYSGLHLVY